MSHSPWIAAATAVVGGFVGWGLNEYVEPPPIVPTHRYSFRVNLVDPTNGGPFQQPTEIDVPTSWDDKMPDLQPTNPPAGATKHTIEVWLGGPGPVPEHPGHEEEDPGPHCHTVAWINGAYRQVHCGY